jgi:hypothetical protein
MRLSSPIHTTRNLTQESIQNYLQCHVALFSPTQQGILLRNRSRTIWNAKWHYSLPRNKESYSGIDPELSAMPRGIILSNTTRNLIQESIQNHLQCHVTLFTPIQQGILPRNRSKTTWNATWHILYLREMQSDRCENPEWKLTQQLTLLSFQADILRARPTKLSLIHYNNQLTLSGLISSPGSPTCTLFLFSPNTFFLSYFILLLSCRSLAT